MSPGGFLFRQCCLHVNREYMYNISSLVPDTPPVFDEATLNVHYFMLGFSPRFAANLKRNYRSCLGVKSNWNLALSKAERVLKNEPQLTQPFDTDFELIVPYDVLHCWNVAAKLLDMDLQHWVNLVAWVTASKDKVQPNYRFIGCKIDEFDISEMLDMGTVG